MTRTAGETPSFPASSLASAFAAGMAALSATAALIARDRDGGLGQRIETPMSDALLEASSIVTTRIEKNPPFVGAGYNFDLGTNTIDASYVATAGTLHIDEVCATHMEGTLTNATFTGITGGFTNPTIDPDGCTFTVASVTFAMGTTPCN